MDALRNAESKAGRMLTRNEVLERADKTGDALLATPPPPGWRLLGPDDALVLTLLPDEEV
jgi:hypothetical protein